jgi:hypothetical protein
VTTGDPVPYIVYDAYGEPASEWERQAEQAPCDGPGPDFEPRPNPEPWHEPAMEAEAGQ